uniref:Uncharacterized protein n=1 Tax=Anguilla anguilla TaxID=7936 RepID=A0A0E9V249_ANGAN
MSHRHFDFPICRLHWATGGLCKNQGFVRHAL